MPGSAKRIDIGFQVGQSLQLRMQEAEYKKLHKALVDGVGGPWYVIKAEDCEVAISLPQVVYLRLDIDREHVGF